MTAAQLVGNDTDPDGDALSVSSVSGATNGTAVLNANGTVTFTPTAGYAGAASFGYKVKDPTGAVSANTATVSLTVTAAANQAPTAVNDGPFTVTNNTPLTLTAAQLVGNDTDPNPATCSVSAPSAAATNGTAVLNANGTVTFTPTTGYTGAASFGYKVKDTTGAVSANTATVSLTVAAAATKHPPRSTDGPFTVTNNTPLTLTAAQLVGNDTDPNPATRSASAPSAGPPTAPSSSTPTAPSPSPPPPATPGRHPSSTTSRQPPAAISPNSATVSITVPPANQAPTAVNDGPFTVTNNTATTLTAAQLVGNDTDPDGDALSVNSVSGAINGTVVKNANGTVTFTPTAGYSGPASFAYKVTDPPEQ